MEYSSDNTRRGRPGHPLAAITRQVTGVLHELFPTSRAVLEAERAEHGWQPDRPDAYCRACGASVAGAAVTDDGCPFCVNQRLPWSGVTRLSGYVEPMRSWLLAMKFQKRWRLCEPLGAELAAAVRGGALATEPGGPWAVTAVPLHWRRRAQRGYNQAQLLADELSNELAWPRVALLRRTRHTLPQTTLSATQRVVNVRQAFEPRRIGRARWIDLTGWSVLLVDDVKTTGSTLGQCTRVLRDMGATRVHIAVAAVADPRGQDFRSV